MLNGWNYERFSKDEIEDATGSPWMVGLSVDNSGFDVTVIRHQVTYVRKRFREEVTS